jgi:hypothetical protein
MLRAFILEGMVPQMAEVDPTKEPIRSYTVRHHKFDPETNHFRWFNVKTFDNEAEMTQLLNQIFEDIERRRNLGEADLKEQVAGNYSHANSELNSRGRTTYTDQD